MTFLNRTYVPGFEYPGRVLVDAHILRLLGDRAGDRYVLTNVTGLYGNYLFQLFADPPIGTNMAVIMLNGRVIAEVCTDGYEDEDTEEWIEGEDLNDYSDIILDIADIIKDSGLRLDLNGTYSLNQEV